MVHSRSEQQARVKVGVGPKHCTTVGPQFFYVFYVLCILVLKEILTRRHYRQHVM